MKMFATMPLADAVETAAELFIGLRADEEWFAQRAQVETGAADEQRNAAATLDLFDCSRCFASPFDGRVIDVRRDEVDQVMGNALSFLDGDLRSRDLDF